MPSSRSDRCGVLSGWPGRGSGLSPFGFTPRRHLIPPAPVHPLVLPPFPEAHEHVHVPPHEADVSPRHGGVVPPGIVGQTGATARLPSGSAPRWSREARAGERARRARGRPASGGYCGARPGGRAAPGLGEIDAELGAVPGVPAKRRPTVPVRFGVEQQQDELECIGETHLVELGRRGERDRGTARVERAAKPAGCGACELTNTCSHNWNAGPRVGDVVLLNGHRELAGRCSVFPQALGSAPANRPKSTGRKRPIQYRLKLLPVRRIVVRPVTCTRKSASVPTNWPRGNVGLMQEKCAKMRTPAPGRPRPSPQHVSVPASRRTRRPSTRIVSPARRRSSFARLQNA